MTCRLAPLLLALAACTPEPPLAPPAAHPPEAGARLLRTDPNIGHDPRAFSVRLPALSPPPPPGSADEAPPPPGLPEPSVVAQLLPAVPGATWDRTRGQALVDAIAALPAERQALGLAGIDLDVLFVDGLCEDPGLLLDLEHEGQPYEALLEVPRTSWLADLPERELYALPEGCAADLLAAAGDVDAALDGDTCTQADERAHFPDGSACRACLEIDGDHGRCVAEDQCPEAATVRIYGNGTWFSILRADMLMCAPDYIVNAPIMVADLEEDDPLPGLFDHGAISGFCVDAWDEADGEARMGCALGEAYGLGDALLSRLMYVRPAGTADDAWVDRIAVTGRVEVEGRTFGLTILGENGAEALSAPLGSSSGAWGLNPLDLRPDGTDPANPEHTQAREYIAALALKTSTTIVGIWVDVYNHNRCPEDGWSGPHADGSYSCDLPGEVSAEGWMDDALITWLEDGAGDKVGYHYPLATLASTGLPDPSVPGGLLPHVLGSSTLADPEWEGCAWPETFTPDRVRMHDPAPISGHPPYASFDGQTYRFGKDPDLDIRLVLSTNQRRAFCVEGL